MRSTPALAPLRTLGIYATLCSTLLLPAGIRAQSPEPGHIAPANRIVAPVSDAARVTLRGNVHPLAAARFDQGAAPASMSTGRIALLLRRSDAQQTALRSYMDELQNPASPRYRKWLTPAAYGAEYGISDADLATVTTWLGSQGFKIEGIPTSRNLIQFSGSVAQLQTAFHTSIHSYAAQGERHFANASDPQIPAALAPVVAGISPLNDFRAKAQHTVVRRGAYDAAAKRIRVKFDPNLTLTDSAGDNFLFVDPADAATIYNTPNAELNGNFAGVANYDGTGITIGILGYSNLILSDIENYRTSFLGPLQRGPLSVIVDNEDPGINSDALEGLLDVEIASGLAPGAAINYYTAASTDLSDGLTLAAVRAIQDNNVSILSVSYGNCEVALGASGNALFNELWMQAAAQGITVTVSTGDNGSAGCDDPNTETVAASGLAVSGLASTPYNVAVGGTDFDVLLKQFDTYVSQAATANVAPYYRSAAGYIPEATWNDSTTSNLLLNGNIAQTGTAANIAATSGGKSASAVCSIALDANGACPGTLSGYPKPAFQTALTPVDTVRDIPDVALFSAAGAYSGTWALCADDVSSGSTSVTGSYTDCQNNDGQFTSSTTFSGVGGTSTATPAFAGILALVAQSQGGVRFGQANNILYNTAENYYTAVFHDINTGNNSVPCATSSPSCGSNGFLTSYNSVANYDYATGLGSVDVTALITAWPHASFTKTTTALTVDGSTAAINATHGAAHTFAITVTPSTATGNVTITNTSDVSNGQASFNQTAALVDGKATFTASDLPGGSYTLSAYYGGDTTSASSTSNLIQVILGSENSTTSLYFNNYDPVTGVSTGSGLTAPYGYFSFAVVQPLGVGSAGGTIPDGIPTGGIGLTSNTQLFFEYSLNSLGIADGQISLAPGSYSFVATYAGDKSFNASTSTAEMLTITKGATTTSVSSGSTAAGTSIVVTVGTHSIGAAPTGSVTLAGGTTSFSQSSTATATAANGTPELQATFLVPCGGLVTGANLLTATYAGDGNYTGSTGTGSITGSGGVSSGAGFCLTGPVGGISIAASGQTATAAISVASAGSFTGAVSLTCVVSSTGAGTLPTCSIQSPVTLTASSTATATLTVNTTAASTSASLATPAQGSPLTRLLPAGGGLTMGCLVLLSLPARRRGWRAMLLLFVSLGVMAASGCGSSSPSPSSSSGTTSPGTQAGAYTVTVTGTSGSTSTNATVAVIVQ